VIAPNDNSLFALFPDFPEGFLPTPLTITEAGPSSFAQKNAENAFYSELFRLRPNYGTLRVLLDTWLDSLQTTGGYPDRVRYLRNASDGILVSCEDRNEAQQTLLDAIVGRELKNANPSYIIVDMLMDLGADSGRALEAAVEAQNTDIAYLILSTDPVAINFQNECTRETAIILAAQKNDFAMLQILTKPEPCSGVDAARAALAEWQACPVDVFSVCIQPFFDLINMQDIYGSTALMHAANHNNLEMVEYLLQCGADTTIQNVDGRRAADFTTCPALKAVITNYEKQN
jgi:hypothetical protein